MSGSKERQTKTGYLFKKGRGIKLAIFKPWAYRWFSLDLETGVLKYYEEIEGRRILKGEVDASVGHVVEHEHKISGRSNCMEILCRRIDKNSHVSTSNTMEVLVLSAVYASQRNDWKKAFLSLNPANKRNSTEPVTTPVVQSVASPGADSVGERNIARLRSLNAALQQVRSLNASPAVLTTVTPPANKSPPEDSPQESQEFNQENAPEAVNVIICETNDPVQTPTAQVVEPEPPAVEDSPDPNSGDECTSDRVLNLDSMLEEADEGTSTPAESISPRHPVQLPTARVPTPEISQEPVSSQVTSTPNDTSVIQKAGENTDRNASSKQLSVGPASAINITHHVEDKNEKLVQPPTSPVQTIGSSEILAQQRLRHGIVNNEKVGYLFKRGRGRSISFLKPWSYRWCSLNIQTGRLSYHAEDEDGTISWKGAVNITDGTIFELDGKQVGKQFAFDISCVGEDPTNKAGGPDAETVTVAAQYKTELEDWMYAFSLIPGCEIVRLESNRAVDDLHPAALLISEDVASPHVVPKLFTDQPNSNVPMKQMEDGRDNIEVDVDEDINVARRTEEAEDVIRKVPPASSEKFAPVIHPAEEEVTPKSPDVAPHTTSTSDNSFQLVQTPIVSHAKSRSPVVATDDTPRTLESAAKSFGANVAASFCEQHGRLPMPSMDSSSNTSEVGSVVDDANDTFFRPDSIDRIDGDKDASWGMASGTALVNILTEEIAILNLENDRLKQELQGKNAEIEVLHQEIANMSSSYEEEMKTQEMMSNAQLAAASDLASELQNKLQTVNAKLARAMHAGHFAEPAVALEVSSKEKNKNGEEYLYKKKLEEEVLLRMATDGQEPMPILPMHLWSRTDVLKDTIRCVLAADSWQKPLVILRNTEDINSVKRAHNGKTTLASMVCRSADIRDKFDDNIFWLHVGATNRKCNAIDKINDSDHCDLLEVLAEKIRKRVCPWLVRKMRKAMSTARDWRLYISDLLHSTKVESRPRHDSIDLEQISYSGESARQFGNFLLVLDDVRNSSVVTALGFLGITTLITTDINWNFDQFGATIEINCPTLGDIDGSAVPSEGTESLVGYKKSSPEKYLSSIESMKSFDENMSSDGKNENNICAFKSAICGDAVPRTRASTVNIAELQHLTWHGDAERDVKSVPKGSLNLSSAFIKLPQEDQYKLISLSILPVGIAYPYELAAALWSCDIESARHTLYTFYSKAWIILFSPGDGFSLHAACVDFLCGQLERLPMIARKHLKENTLDNMVKWLVCPDAFAITLLRHGYDLSYITIWTSLSEDDKIGKFQEQFMTAIKNMKYLSSSDRLSTLYFITYAATLAMRIPSDMEDNKAWCEDWIRKSLQYKMNILSEKSIVSNLYVFRNIFPYLLDCNVKHMIYADAISYLQQLASYQRIIDAKTQKPSFAAAELLVYQAAFHYAAGRLHRATEMHKEACLILRDHLNAPGAASFLDSIWLTQVLYKLKQVAPDGQANEFVDDDYSVSTEILDEAMSGRKAFLGCDEHPRLTDLIQLSGELYARSDGGDTMSRKLFKAALMMRCLQLGESHPGSVVLFEQMSLSLESINKPISALPYVEKLTDLSRTTFGDMHPFSMHSTVLLSCILRGLSREEEAIRILTNVIHHVRQLISNLSDSAQLNSFENYLKSDKDVPAPHFLGLLVLAYANVATSPSLSATKKYIPKSRKLLLEVLKMMHARKMENPRGTSEQDDAVTASILFKLGTICEDAGDFNKSKKYYSSASTAFAEVGDMYHLCSILSLVRLSACEVNLGEIEDSKHLLAAAAEALDDVILNGIPTSFAGVSRRGVHSVVDLTLESRFYCAIFRVMEWHGLVLPDAALEMKEAVDKLLKVAEATK